MVRIKSAKSNVVSILSIVEKIVNYKRGKVIRENVHYYWIKSVKNLRKNETM